MLKKLEILNPVDKFVVFAKIAFLSLFFVPALGFVFQGILENKGEISLVFALFGLLSYSAMVVMSKYPENE